MSSPYTLEKLEKLARAKFEIGRFTSDDFIGPNNTDEAALRNIAQSRRHFAFPDHR